MNRDERVKELSQKLLDGVQETFKSDHFQKYLKAVSVFHGYSWRNIELILLQKPNATYVAGYEAWKKLGRYVLRGEKGISIFAPSKVTEKSKRPLLDDDGNPKFNDDGSPLLEETNETRIRFLVVVVFDVSQTEGDPLPALCNELQGAVPDFQRIFSAVQSISPYEIVYEDMSGDMKGYCRHTDKKIALKLGMSDEQIVKTLIHEFAHATLHANSSKSREQKEIEAESTAFIVSSFLGIDTSGYSFDYVSSWSYAMETSQLQEVLESIQVSANEMIVKIQAAMELLEKTPELTTQKLPERLSAAAKKSEQLNGEKEMIPSGKLLTQ